ncbi:MAG: DUF3079 domain-containing protein [Proteobacteria bacterium]|nr:DUF3079 domain-containing protein [Pseudomonadota bacterium]
MTPKLPLHPPHPERICWGCDKYCATDELRCGNGTDRAQHPSEIFGNDWLLYGLDAATDAHESVPAAPSATSAKQLRVTRKP